MAEWEVSAETVVIAALIRRLGGEVTLTEKELREAMDLELQRHDAADWSGNVSYRVRPAPVTVQGETVDDIRELNE